MKTEKQQTAIEWYAEEAMRLQIKKVKGNISVYHMINELSNVLEQAKAMEKDQIIDTFQDSRILSVINNCSSGEQYYNETFKSE